MVLQNNNKTLMTGRIFKGYLLWFDEKIASKSMILLIDRFSAHHDGLNLLQKEFTQSLTNTEVIFFLANATSLPTFGPKDHQGIEGSV